MIKTLPNPATDLLNRACSCFPFVLFPGLLEPDPSSHLESFSSSDVLGFHPEMKQMKAAKSLEWCFVRRRRMNSLPVISVGNFKESA